MDRATIEAEVMAVYDRYLDSFNRSDMAGIAATIQFPLTHIGNGKARSYDSYPFDPAKLRAEKQWHTTINARHEVVAASPDKAHLILHSADRVRADGSLIERVSAFYAFIRTPDGWKIFAISDVANPE